MKKQNKINETLKAVAIPDPKANIDRELDNLKQILQAVENMTEAEKGRTFRYLKDRYKTAWPVGDY